MRKRTKFIPDEKFLADNGKEFPEVKISSKSGRINWENYNSVEDFQKFIDYLSGRGILNYKRDLEKISRGLFYKAQKLGLINYLKFSKKLSDLSGYNTVHDFQEYIDSNSKIIYPEDLKRINRGLYDKAVKLNFLKELEFQKQKIRHTECTVEDFQTFIEQNNISRPSEFEKLNLGLYTRARRLGILKDLKFNFRANSWSYINTIQDVIDFIKTNNIKNSTDFQKRYPGVWVRLHKLRITSEDFNSYYPNPRKSFLEIRVERFLLDNKIKFKNQTLVKGSRLRFDFWLPEYNLVLEPGGEHHFIPINKFGGIKNLKQTKRRDKRKFKFCKKNNIKIIYWFSFENRNKNKIYNILETNGYHGEYYLDFDEFCNRILEIVGQKK